ncbi:MAG: hypothetical protein EBU20_10035 [Betaproteobacteria bacterium]|nr:hypothetical protein [Betaproteobacteria bacterium]
MACLPGLSGWNRPRLECQRTSLSTKKHPSGGARRSRRWYRFVGAILGQPLVVDNKLGAGGNIGVEYVMKSKPDGYTLLVSPATIATNVAVYRKLPYDLIKDLQAITLIGQTGVVLVVHPSVKVNNLKEFVELMKAKNGDMNYGSAGMGSPQHLQAEFFNQLVG